jgi:uncharacterized protein YndB with AHSA1/START domain
MAEGAMSQVRFHEPMEFSQPGDRENRASRLFRASPERVFRLFTDRATVPLVLSEDPGRINLEVYDFRPGGRFSFVFPLKNGTRDRMFGEYQKIVPPKLVVNTFQVDSSPEIKGIETDEFVREGEFTRVTVTWKFDRPESRNKMWGPEAEASVTAMWNHIEELLEKGAPEEHGSRA